MAKTTIVVGLLEGISIAPDLSELGGEYNVLVNHQYGQIENPRGFTRAYNPLIAAAFLDPECQFCWVMNSDVIPIDNVLWETQAIMEADPTIGAITPMEGWLEDGEFTTVLSYEVEKCSIEKALTLDPAVMELPFCGFGCVCISRAAWEAVGPLDEALGRGYAEDTDWGFRCWQAGFRCVNYRRAWFQHERGSTYGRLVELGHIDPMEPHQACVRLKEKWPDIGLWEVDAYEVLRRLKDLSKVT